MKDYYIGIDSGSTMCKLVLSHEQDIVDFHLSKTGWSPRLSASESLEQLLLRNALFPDDVIITATGYGRETIDFADYVFTEITCHAYGGMYFNPEIQGIIDIGGQDSKVIQIYDKKVSDFLMNDKCAAGTGRFLSMACDILDIDLFDIDEFTDIIDPISISSMCTVFAESEIIGLLSMEKDRSKIMGGVLQSIAQKIRAMTGKINFDLDIPIFMSGGLSRSNSLIEMISKTTGLKIVTHEYALYAGAIGACICGYNKNKL